MPSTPMPFRIRPHAALPRLAMFCLLLLLIGLPAASAFGATLDTRLPGGRGNYVVAMSSFTQGSYTNWMRLGTYEFRPNGTVTARMWVWLQTRPTARVSSGVTPMGNCVTTSKTSYANARYCTILTAGGFTGAPNEVRTGTFKLSGTSPQTVSISWNNGNRPWNETHTVVINPNATQPMAQLRLNYSTAIARDAAAPGGFRGGFFAYGSVRPLTERRHMTSVYAYQPRTTRGLVHDYLTMGGRNVAKKWLSAPFGHKSFKPCDGNARCLTKLAVIQDTDDVGICGKPSCASGKDRRLLTYWAQLGTADRRDTYWHWCTCLADARKEFCYTGNSHVKPMLQILDDNGHFAGYVGVEASFGNPSNRGNPRDSDMLALFRFAEFR